MCIRDSGEIAYKNAIDLEQVAKRDPGNYQYLLSLIHISEPTRLLSNSYAVFCFLKKRQPTRSKRVRSSAASDVYKRQRRDRVQKCDRLGAGRQTRPGQLPVPAVSYTHLRAHETTEQLVCRLLLFKKTATNEI